MRYYIAALIIIVLSTGMASAFSQEWAAAVSGTLNKGGTLTNGEFMVKAVQFPSPVPGIKGINGNIIPETPVDPMVFLEIYKNGVLIKELIMNLQSEPFIDPDYEVNVSATGFPAKNARGWVYEYYSIEPPWVTISIQTRAKPKLEVAVTTDKSAYTSYTDQTITAKVTVTNSEARAKNIDVYLNIGELQLRGGDTSQLHQYYYEMKVGDSPKSFDVILVVPELIDQKSYTLSAEAKGFDVKDLEYKAAKTSTTITVSPKQNYFVISKSVKDRIYLQDIVPVRITVGNGGMFDIYNIHVTDSMSENFELKSNTSFQWDIPALKPGQEWGTTYSIKPLETNINGFTIPAVTAQYTVNNKQYSGTSTTTTVIVNGPKIILNKTVDKPVVNISEDVTVTVRINNVGNIATKAEIKDSLPDAASLVRGSTNLTPTFLELNTPQGFNYTIRMNQEGEVKLPAAVANYTGVEYKGTARSVLSSDRPVITVIDPSKIAPTPTENPAPAEVAPTPIETTPDQTSSPSTNTPEPTPTPITPGFGIAFAVVVLVVMVVIRRR